MTCGNIIDLLGHIISLSGIIASVFMIRKTIKSNSENLNETIRANSENLNKTIKSNSENLNETIRANLRTEYSWRAELFEIASSDKIERKHLLRLQASQHYHYIRKDNKGEENTNNDVNYKVRDKIGNSTFNLYKKYIVKKSKRMTREDKQKIRYLAIALLKYDFIKRGDNNHDKNKLKNDYQELLNWINEVIWIRIV